MSVWAYEKHVEAGFFCDDFVALSDVLTQALHLFFFIAPIDEKLIDAEYGYNHTCDHEEH